MGGKALEGAKSLGGKAMESVGLKAAATVPGALTPFGEVGAKRAAAAAAGTAGKEGVAALIKKSIAKRVPKAVASAVGKSIPFLGAAIGVGFALSRLMDGDVVGAGLEAVSGIGSVATAIPATVALLAKDIYQDVYGIKPESDPLVGERMGIIQSETEAAVKAEFAGKVGEEEKTGGDKKDSVTASQETKVPEAAALKDEKGATNSDAVIPGGGQITDPNAPNYNAEYAEVKRESDEFKAKAKETSPSIAPKLQSAQPNTGEKMAQQSNENTMAKTEAMTGGNNTNTSIVSAPKVTNATNVTNAPINVRNSENTFVRNQDRISSF
jgi:hypothetical protein